MDKELEQRLDLLKEVGEITQEIKDVIEGFIDKFEKKYLLKMTEENASMFITHLAMALPRIQKGEEVEGLNELALNEIKQNVYYQELPEFYQEIEGKLNIEIPESEKGYLALHAITLIEKSKK